MENHDGAMLTFVKLARISQARGQLQPRDKFLILAAVAASRGGHSAVAARCRELVLAHNSAHLMKRCGTIEESLADVEFQLFIKQLSRFCTLEKGEHLLSQLAPEAQPPQPADDLSPEAYALWLLSDEQG